MGAEALPEARLREAIATEASGCRSPLLFLICLVGDFGWAEREARLDPAEVERDEERLETLYETWGYPDAEVEAVVLREEDGDAVVEFRIREGRPILVEEVTVVGLDTLAPPVRLPRPLPLRAGVPYALPRLEATQQRILAALSERGRPFATVEVGGEVDEAAGRARIVLEVTPGPRAVFGPVTVRAERPIEEDVIRERLAYRPGEPFRPSALDRTEEALLQLPAVERVVVEPVPPTLPDTAVPTVVTVAARRIQGLEVEGTISSTDCLEVAAFWVHRYFLGGPRLFSLGVGAANLLAEQVDGGFPCTSAGEGPFGVVEYFGRAELRQPWPGDPRTALLLLGFVRRDVAPRVSVQEGFGGEVTVARELGRGLFATLGWAPERNELDAVGAYFCANFGVCTPEGIEELAEPTWLAPVELLATWIPPESAVPPGPPAEDVPEWLRPERPRWRPRLRAGLEAAAGFTGSEYDFVRGIVEPVAVREIGPGRLSAAFRARVGLLGSASDVLPPQIRLYSGGVNTVRGVEQNLLGPKVLLAAPENLDELGCAAGPVPGCVVPGVVDPELVSVRPTGGDVVVEANVEGRLWLTDALQLAAFVDYGTLWRDALAGGGAAVESTERESLVTPGVGIRVLTGLGPIRVDVAYNPSGTRLYPLLAVTEEGGLEPLGLVEYNPFEAGDPGTLTEFWRRLQFHVAIGQPF